MSMPELLVGADSDPQSYLEIMFIRDDCEKISDLVSKLLKGSFVTVREEMKRSPLWEFLLGELSAELAPLMRECLGCDYD